MNASHLEIIIGGKEKSSYWYSTGGEHNERRKAKSEHKIMHFKGTAHTFAGPLQPGDY